jgi:hypothetical protein
MAGLVVAAESRSLLREVKRNTVSSFKWNPLSKGSSYEMVLNVTNIDESALFKVPSANCTADGGESWNFTEGPRNADFTNLIQSAESSEDGKPYKPRFRGAFEGKGGGVKDGQGGGAPTWKLNGEYDVIKVVIHPSEINAFEGLDSEPFTCEVHPTNANVTSYRWLSGASNGAWSASAGNNPTLDYISGSSKSSAVRHTRWFAKTPSSLSSVDGPIASYNINCEVIVDGQTVRAATPATLAVVVILGTECSPPEMVDEDTISVAISNGVWVVTGQGNFRRTAPVPGTTMLTTNSQFYAKIMAHENKHVHQWTNEFPWVSIYSANICYTNLIKGLTGTNETDLRMKISNAVRAKASQDLMVFSLYRCEAEAAANQVEKQTPPHFLEFSDSEWRAVYNCQ